MTNKEFIKKIGDAAVKQYAKYKILPSLTIAQAILESAWGKSDLATSCHNYFGMKWTSGCGCDYKEYSTKEQRKDGSYYTIKAKFRKYDSVAAGIEGYYKFLQYPRYANLKGVTDYKKACELIRKDGWATSLNYTNSLIKLIETYKLNEYDDKVINSNTKKTSATMKVKASALNCRNKPGMTGKVIAVFTNGQKVTVKSKSNAAWYKVTGTYSGKSVTGYCASKYLE